MTLLLGRSQKQLWTPHQSWSIASIPNQNVAPGNTAMPTTNPGAGSAPITFTLSSADFPTLPVGWTCDWVLVGQVGGQNNDGASRTVNIQLYRNSTSVKTTAVLVATTAHWSAEVTGIVAGLAAGDTVQLTVWATSSVNCDWSEAIIEIWPTHIRPGRPGPWLLANFDGFTSGVLGDVTVTGVTNATASANFNWQYPGVQNTTAPTSPAQWFIGATNGLGGLNLGGISTVSTSATAQNWWRYWGPTAWGGRLLVPRMPA